ncbi:ABC transporter ATP-binding protein [Sediminibacterium sp. WSJ-3]|nr:ABC transporter ATP-binding protein [Sediminibacterium soli]
MTITLADAGKRFNRDWIFRRVDYRFIPGTSYAITGPNGSGKSTLLQAIAGSLLLNEGSISYAQQQRGVSTGIDSEQVYLSMALAAPYLELIEEMTARELLRFHHHFKPLVASLSVDEMLDLVELGKAADKQIRYYSSGMKQRVKLAQAVFSDTPVLLLDEPCTNLDAAGYALYHRLIKTYCRHKLIVVSSNDTAEMEFCEQRISILDYK